MSTHFKNIHIYKMTNRYLSDVNISSYPDELSVYDLLRQERERDIREEYVFHIYQDTNPFHIFHPRTSIPFTFEGVLYTTIEDYYKQHRHEDEKELLYQLEQCYHVLHDTYPSFSRLLQCFTSMYSFKVIVRDESLSFMVNTCLGKLYQEYHGRVIPFQIAKKNEYLFEHVYRALAIKKLSFVVTVLHTIKYVYPKTWKWNSPEWNEDLVRRILHTFFPLCTRLSMEDNMIVGPVPKRFIQVLKSFSVYKSMIDSMNHSMIYILWQYISLLLLHISELEKTLDKKVRFQVNYDTMRHYYSTTIPEFSDEDIVRALWNVCVLYSSIEQTRVEFKHLTLAFYLLTGQNYREALKHHRGIQLTVLDIPKNLQNPLERCLGYIRSIKNDHEIRKINKRIYFYN